ncbi:hypothetical protein EC840_10782 [Rahnella sp. JUb53]|nr:hypothetical protein EC840_10782 [Rahnella sp. JUb53]
MSKSLRQDSLRDIQKQADSESGLYQCSHQRRKLTF